MNRRYVNANHQMGGTRANIKLDAVVIAFQQCLDYNPLRLVFASLNDQVKIRNFAFDVRIRKVFLRNKGEEHGLKAMIRECANLQYLCIFASVKCPILTRPQLPNGALPSPDTKYSFEKQVRESSSQMCKEWESARLMVERYFEILIVKEHLPAVELE